MKITLNTEQKVWVTSDTHYGHKNIVQGVTDWPLDSKTLRPFDTIDQMNDDIVNKINAIVGQDDYLLHLGDWSLGGIDNIWNFRRRIICNNIILVLGNHDHHIKKNRQLPNAYLNVFGDIVDVPAEPGFHVDQYPVFAQDLFTAVLKIDTITFVKPGVNRNDKHTKHTIVVSHFPISSWEGMSHGHPHLHGHIHSVGDDRFGVGRRMDCGIDGNIKKQPYLLDTVLTTLKKKPIKSDYVNDHHI